MSLLVVAYPRLAKKDFDWIQEYRSKNDPRFYSIVKPHITLVFANSEIQQDVFISEAKDRVQHIKKFECEFKVATINQDDSGEYFHEFLVPDRGYSDIVKLHDALYSGKFAPYLRFDIDFIPHIGIGNSDKAEVAKERIDGLNKQGIQINGEVGVMDVIEYNDGTVTTVEQVWLAE